MTKTEAEAVLAAPQGDNYPFITVYCRMVGSHAYYISDEMRRAMEHKQPADTWATQQYPAGAHAPDMTKPFRLAHTGADTRRRIISEAARRFPNNPVVRAAMTLYADDIAERVES